MPFSDPEKQREYQRNYKREQRSGLTACQTSNLIELPARIKSARDVLNLLNETIGEVQRTENDVLIKARCIGYLASITLKAIETVNIEGRIESLEEILKARKQ